MCRDRQSYRLEESSGQVFVDGKIPPLLLSQPGLDGRLLVREVELVNTLL